MKGVNMNKIVKSLDEIEQQRRLKAENKKKRRRKRLRKMKNRYGKELTKVYTQEGGIE